MGVPFMPIRAKIRIAGAGPMIKGYGFMTPEEKAELQRKAALKQALKRDSGRADQLLRKF